MVFSRRTRSLRLRHHGLLAVVLSLLLGEGDLARAGDSSEQPPPSSISLTHAITEGARRSPVVVESSRTRAAAMAFGREPGSSLPSVPQLTILAGARAPTAFPTGPEVAITVQQEIAWRNLGSARRRAAEWAAHAAESELERVRLEGAATAALAWIDLLEAQNLAHLRSSSVEDATKLARLAEIRVVSGVATAVERSLANAEVGNAELAVLDGEGRTTEARIELAYAMGQKVDRAFVADGVLDSTEDAAVDERVVRNVGNHPAVRAAEGLAAQSSAEASVARASAGPSFSLGATVWREGSGDRAAAAIVTIPLPFFDPARYDSARQATLAAAASGRASRVRAELERKIRIALHDCEHTRALRAQLRQGVVEPLRAALRTAMAAYSAGTSDLGVVLLARRSALAAEERLVVATADIWRANVRASALTGTLLEGIAR